MTTILPLEDAVDPAACGGKAANLARLIAAGAPVPHGVVIVDGALDRRPVDLAAALALLPATLIVRSSAIGEDSADASFAGQLESIADVTSPDLLRAAVARVSASRGSERVRAYQAARGKVLAGMGVIVQRQVPAALSGVLFTVSPTAPAEMLLEYCGGMGEALVSGAVNPGRVSIHRTAKEGRYPWKHIAAPDDPAPAEYLLLTDSQISTLARLALDIEAVFGSPQDIEWTIDAAGKLWIVQSRPITTAPDLKTHGPKDPRTQVWSNANVNENFPQPISPLLYSIARQGYYHYFRNLGTAFGISENRLRTMEPALRQIIGVHGARMYYNLTSIHSVLRSAPFGDLLSGSFNQFVGAEETSARRLGAAYRVRQAGELAVIAAKTTWQYLFVTSRVEKFERTVDAYASETHPDRLARKPLADLLRDFRGFLEIRNHRWTNASLADAGAMVCYGLLQRLLARACPARDQQALHNTLLKALPDLVSSMPPLKLWELSRMVRASAELDALVRDAAPAQVLRIITSEPRHAAFREAFETFLTDWGFRCSGELMLTVPSFQEEPGPVIELLKAYAAMDGEAPPDLLKRQAAERIRETAAVMAALGWRQRLIVGTILRWTQRSIQLRERARFKQALLYSRLRRVSLAIGDRLASAGRIERPDDVFFLSAEELELLAAGGAMFPDHVKQLVALRRSAHADLSATVPPDSLELCAGDYMRAGAASEVTAPDGDLAASLTGVGACGGSTTARAAILLDVTESHKLTAGDVLVTRQTDPGWGPVFPLISGLVIERGGMLSHGAIIAREFGIPSVVGVKDATRLIPHGVRVTVDGNEGVVRFAGAA
jgi:pyruvate,water dikinase